MVPDALNGSYGCSGGVDSGISFGSGTSGPPHIEHDAVPGTICESQCVHHNRMAGCASGVGDWGWLGIGVLFHRAAESHLYGNC